jgi:hypothetical protein
MPHLSSVATVGLLVPYERVLVPRKGLDHRLPKRCEMRGLRSDRRAFVAGVVSRKQLASETYRLLTRTS